MREDLPNRRYATAAPLRSSPAVGSFYPSRTAQIGTVLHSDLTVRHQFLGGDGG